MAPEFQSLCDDYREVLAGRTTGWCQLHPREDERHWNAQQVIEHLVLAMRSSARVVETRVERGRPTRRRGTLIQRVLRGMILRTQRLPRGAPAPPFARPGLLRWPPMNGEELSGILRQELEATDRLLETCRERFGERPAASHFLLGPLSAEQWRRFLTVHGRHHLEQLHRVEAAVGSGTLRSGPAAEEEAGTAARTGL